MKEALSDQQRLDAWLWCARLVKSRARAVALVREGRVRINRRPTEKPDARVRPGDVLTVPLGQAVRVVAIRGLARRRGPAAQACLLYDEVREAPALLPGGSEAGIQPGREPAAGRKPGAGRNPGGRPMETER
jgi:ribosome-associated heat shock protein Hsp15